MFSHTPTRTKRNTLTITPQSTVNLWNRYYSLGNTAHQHQLFSKAIWYFEQCINLCTTLSKQKAVIGQTKTVPTMRHQASHNLAACHNAMGQGLIAKDILKKLHSHFLHIASCPHQTRAIKLDVLANIDQSLFSLTSQLAYLNQVEEIHSIIIETEKIITVASDTLLRDPYVSPTNHSTFAIVANTNNIANPTAASFK